MPIRDVIVFCFYLLSLPISFLNPVNGVILYAFVSTLYPHRLTWNFAYSLPMAQAVAVAAILGLVFYKGDRKFPFVREMLLVGLLWLLASLGWFDAFNPSGYVREWNRLSKILLMIALTVSLIKTRKDLKRLYWVIVLSVGFYTLKGAIWSFKGHAGMVYGPPGSFFEGNNGLGLVINMAWPLFLMIARTEENKWTKALFWFLFIVSPLTIIRTNSRASALAMGVTAVFLLARVKRKFVIILVGCLVTLATVQFIPSGWYERMETIKTYEEDSSAMGRINAWHAGWNMAVDRPLTGGGLRAFTKETIWRYAPDPENFHDVHSIYFEVLGEVGFPGFITFLALIASMILSLLSVSRKSKSLPDGKFFSNYADGTLLGLVAYLTNGAFLGAAFNEVFYQFVAFTVLLKVILSKEIELFTAGGETTITKDDEAHH